MHTILTVKELTQKIKGALESSLPYVWVRGQVSNLSRPSSGHVYFTLKDAESALAAVWFKGSQQNAERFDPLTGEVYAEGAERGGGAFLADGQEVICAGRLTVYQARGVYQLVVELAQDAGQGKLQLEFERLKSKLQGKGYFAQERKRTLPLNPTRVAVITSPSGAAVHDFLRVAQSRGLASQIRIYPSPVQGEDAPARIIDAIRLISAEGWAQALVLIRGGGALEDLWAFNSEALAEAVFRSPLPVLAGIGHEVDFTLADLTADVRAATPSHAAQLLWAERRESVQRVDELELALKRAQATVLREQERRLQNLAKVLQWASPEKTLHRALERLSYAQGRLNMLWRHSVEQRSQSVRSIERLLSAWPEKHAVLLQNKEVRLQSMVRRLHNAAQGVCFQAEKKLDTAHFRVNALNPMQPLVRGYVLAKLPDGAFLRSAKVVATGDELELVLVDGNVPVVVR